MTTKCRETALRLPGVNGARLPAMLYRPPTDRARGSVLVCPPLFEERKACQRVLTDMARALAGEAFYWVLRFDYRGTGDAEGDFEFFALRDWLQDVRAAAAWLAAHGDGLEQTWLGIRLGAWLATHAAIGVDERSAPRNLVLWEPVGAQTFVRQLMQRRMVNDMLAYGRARESRTALHRTLDAGKPVDLDGFSLTAEQYRQLGDDRFGAFAGPGMWLDTGNEHRAVENLASAAPKLVRQTLRVPPFWNSVGHVDTEAWTRVTVAWLQDQGREEHPVSVGDLNAKTREFQGETLVTIDSGGQRLQGVWHAPPSQAPRGAVLFLSGWSGDRQGPHRMFVQLARRLVAEGYACLRFDYRGRGTSDGTVGEAGIASMTDDALAALEWMAGRLPPDLPFTLVAICSGCKVALSTAAANPRVQSMALWSAEAMGSLRARDTNLRKTLGALRAYARKLGQAQTWRKLLRGQVQTDMVRKAVAKHETRSREEARAEDAILKQLHGFPGRLLFVYGGSDPDGLPASAAYERFCRRRHIDFQLERIPHAGHSYYGQAWKNQLFEITNSWLNCTVMEGPPPNERDDPPV